MRSHLIFVGGIHGVGKTVLCEKLCDLYEIQHLVASDIIRNSQSHIPSSDKQVYNVTKNQDVLISFLDSHLNDRQLYLLDGHFCLLGVADQIQKIPLTIFHGISPRACLVIWDEIENIAIRLYSRDNRTYDLDLLRQFQDNEIAHAEYICATLKIPLLAYKFNSEFQKASSFVQTHIKA